MDLTSFPDDWLQDVFIYLPVFTRYRLQRCSQKWQRLQITSRSHDMMQTVLVEFARVPAGYNYRIPNKLQLGNIINGRQLALPDMRCATNIVIFNQSSAIQGPEKALHSWLDIFLSELYDLRPVHEVSGRIRLTATRQYHHVVANISHLPISMLKGACMFKGALSIELRNVHLALPDIFEAFSSVVEAHDRLERTWKKLCHLHSNSPDSPLMVHIHSYQHNTFDSEASWTRIALDHLPSPSRDQLSGMQTRLQDADPDKLFRSVLQLSTAFQLQLRPRSADHCRMLLHSSAYHPVVLWFLYVSKRNVCLRSAKPLVKNDC